MIFGGDDLFEWWGKVIFDDGCECLDVDDLYCVVMDKLFNGGYCVGFSRVIGWVLCCWLVLLIGIIFVLFDFGVLLLIELVNLIILIIRLVVFFSGFWRVL